MGLVGAAARQSLLRSCLHVRNRDLHSCGRIYFGLGSLAHVALRAVAPADAESHDGRRQSNTVKVKVDSCVLWCFGVFSAGLLQVAPARRVKCQGTAVSFVSARANRAGSRQSVLVGQN